MDATVGQSPDLDVSVAADADLVHRRAKKATAPAILQRMVIAGVRATPICRVRLSTGSCACRYFMPPART